MKHLIFSLLIMLFVAPIFGQQIFMTQNGTISFFSKAPLEDIEATNTEVSAALNLSSNEVVVRMNMTDFHFEKSLMEEHFNENYIESDQYPTAIFQGTIITEEDITQDGEYSAMTKGEITLHGVTRPYNSEIMISTTDGKMHATTNFKIKTKDHDIKIPKIVIKNIAEVIDVTVDLNLEKLEN